MSVIETAYLALVVFAFTGFAAVLGGVVVYTATDPANRKRPKH
ncbi:hypothetical protein P7B02_01750 [Caulobacter segnis]|nr:hypothetical protein [Caulobacter segnis]MDG2520248.1 hypothetical protein [Caulobacter segnis]